LKDVSFEVAEGETVGIIGANGAGKSTLLSLVAGTMAPTSGRIETRGVISSLLELGAGFHPDLTGRENIFLYGAIMGLPLSQLKKRFDAIVSFAELEKFIDQPVKYYSSGMCVRLGFSVAVEVDPDILLVDEVLAVGDTAFQRKCLARMEEFRRQHKTMLIVSHDLPTIQMISDRILLLDNGEVKGWGESSRIVEMYKRMAREKSARSLGREWGTGELKITGVVLCDEHGKQTDTFRFNGALEATISYTAIHPVENPVFGFSITNERGNVMYGNNTQIEGVKIDSVAGEGRIKFRISHLKLARGNYFLSFSAHSWDHKVNYHRLDNFLAIAVESDRTFEGCYMDCEWKMDE
jgi:ABC-type polysaccharide/polyol phosphate transport system ATPase subunit